MPNQSQSPATRPTESPTQTRATFTAWMRATNAEVQRRAGLDVLDLPDIDFRSLYDDYETPATAAQYAIDNADDAMHDEDNDE